MNVPMLAPKVLTGRGGKGEDSADGRLAGASHNAAAPALLVKIDQCRLERRRCCWGS